MYVSTESIYIIVLKSRKTYDQLIQCLLGATSD